MNQIVTIIMRQNLILNNLLFLSVCLNIVNHYNQQIISLFILLVYIVIFFASRYSFGILFVFLRTYYGICFFHINFLKFFLLLISFYIYFLLALLVFLYHCHNNLLLYLVLFLCFFDNKLYYSFFLCITKKIFFFMKYSFYHLNWNYSLIFLLHVYSCTENKFYMSFLQHEQWR